MKKLVIFDCDGVMFSSREANRAYYNHLLAVFGCPSMNEDELSYVHSHNVQASVTHIFRNHPEISPEKIEQCRSTLDYRPFLDYMIIEPDLIDFLRLITPGRHTAVSTNRTNTMEMILDIFKLRPWFEMVVTSVNVPRPKPAPDGLYMILDHFKTTTAESIYIGDSEVDREHCAAVGVDLIAFKNPDLAAEYHVQSFMEILDLPPMREPGTGLTMTPENG